MLGAGGAELSGDPVLASPGQSRKEWKICQVVKTTTVLQAKGCRGPRVYPLPDPRSPPHSLAQDQAHGALKKDFTNEELHCETVWIPCWSLKKLRPFKRKEATKCPYLPWLPLKTPQLTCVPPIKTQKWTRPSTWKSAHYGEPSVEF